MRLVTVALPDGSTTAARRDGDGLHAFSTRSARYADVGALLRGGVDDARHRAADRRAPLVRPVLEPAATVCVGVNYGAHMREMGREPPTSPTLFLKLPQALIDPGEPVVIPPESAQVDYEGELVAVIGRGGRRIPARGGARARRRRDADERRLDARLPVPLAAVVRRQVVARLDAGRARGRHPRRARRPRRALSSRRP